MRRLRRVRIKKYPTLPKAQTGLGNMMDISKGINYYAQNNPAINPAQLQQTVENLKASAAFQVGQTYDPTQQPVQPPVQQDPVPTEEDLRNKIMLGNYGKGMSTPPEEESTQLKIYQDSTPEKGRTVDWGKIGFWGDAGAALVTGMAQKEKDRRQTTKRTKDATDVHNISNVKSADQTMMASSRGFDQFGQQAINYTGFEGQKPAMGQRGGQLKRVRIKRYPGGLPNPGYTGEVFPVLQSGGLPIHQATGPVGSDDLRKHIPKDRSKIPIGTGKDMTDLGEGIYGKGTRKKWTPDKAKNSSGSSPNAAWAGSICDRIKKGATVQELVDAGHGHTAGLTAQFADCFKEAEKTNTTYEYERIDTPEEKKEEKEEKVTCPKCADGTDAVYNETTKKCECPEEKRQEEQIAASPPQPDAPYWLQDTIKMGAAFGDLMSVKKYLPWAPKVDLETPTPTFVDPTRELAKQSETANIAAKAAASFAGPQGLSARAAGIQGTAAGQAADTLARVNQQNVGIANQFGQQAAQIANQESLANQKISSKLFDQTTIANQQYDNAKRAARANLVNTFTGAVTNRWQADAMNQMYQDYDIDVSVGGAFTPNPQYKNTQLSTPVQSPQERLRELMSDKPGMGHSLEEAKLIMDAENNKAPKQQQSASASGLINAFGAQQQPYKVPFRDGGETSYPSDTYNSTQYGNGTANPTGSKGRPSFKTTNSLYPVPRDEANLEAEGGETVFGDINGDGFPESNVIRGNRHSEGGVPLNLPDNTFIFSDFKEMKIKDPELLKMFGKDRSKKSKSKKGYTPAQLAKQYDINKYRQILQDPDEDAIAKRTAEIMIQNYNKKLGALSLAQEAQKGFPQGIPTVARPYMEANGISEDAVLPQAELTSDVNQEQIFEEASQG